ncbi:MAG: sulfate ABC transporter ATP-binding protein [Lautropia sp.]|nr:sulfate ABC transporter ATP-binding protein [Lautropia sp.]
MSILIQNLNKRFGKTVVCDDITLDIGSGELVALLGPSGSGKTSLLRIIAGLEQPDSGRVLFHGKDTTEEDPRSRQVGFVFQHYALFNHMSIFENVAFGLRVQPRRIRPAEEVIRDRVMSLLKMVQLDWLAERFPSQLSGGQRQRIALARALAVEPRVLLLDEPFGALDAQVRKELRRWLRRLHDEMQVTSVFVTHDQDEAMEVADRVVVLNKGRVEQSGSPEEVYDRPATPFVLKFLGDVNLFRGHFDSVSPPDETRAGTVTSTPASAGGEGGHRMPDVGRPRTDIEEVVYVRPHEIDVLPENDPTPGTLPVAFSQALTVGPRTRLEFRRPDDGSFIDVEMSRAGYLALRQQIGLFKGQTVRLRARQETRFRAGVDWSGAEGMGEPADPASMI